MPKRAKLGVAVNSRRPPAIRYFLRRFMVIFITPPWFREWLNALGTGWVSPVRRKIVESRHDPERKSCHRLADANDFSECAYGSSPSTRPDADSEDQRQSSGFEGHFGTFRCSIV